jgi:hypothetical protein
MWPSCAACVRGRLGAALRTARDPRSYLDWTTMALFWFLSGEVLLKVYAYGIQEYWNYETYHPGCAAAAAAAAAAACRRVPTSLVASG